MGCRVTEYIHLTDYRGGVMSWIKTNMTASAVCGVLAGGVTSLAFSAEDGHIKEVIKHAKEGITH
jgi:hypothetical protein